VRLGPRLGPRLGQGRWAGAGRLLPRATHDAPPRPAGAPSPPSTRVGAARSTRAIRGGGGGGGAEAGGRESSRGGKVRGARWMSRAYCPPGETRRGAASDSARGTPVARAAWWRGADASTRRVGMKRADRGGERGEGRREGREGERRGKEGGEGSREEREGERRGKEVGEGSREERRGKQRQGERRGRGVRARRQCSAEAQTGAPGPRPRAPPEGARGGAPSRAAPPQPKNWSISITDTWSVYQISN